MSDSERQVADDVRIHWGKVCTAAFSYHYRIHGNDLHFDRCPEPNCESWRESIAFIGALLIDG